MAIDLCEAARHMQPFDRAVGLMVSNESIIVSDAVIAKEETDY